MSKLSKPVFVKIENLLDGRSGYNVYVKVVSVDITKSNDGKSEYARAVVADQTGSANAFFKGQTVSLIKNGAVLAIRNGRLRFIANHISLEIDIFGRVTPENLAIKPNTANNISEKTIEKRERKPKRDERRSHEHRDRPRRREEEGRERHHRENKEPRENGEHREHRQHRQNHKDERQYRHREERPQREQNREQRPRREQGQRRHYREDREDRRQNKNEEVRRRPQISWTKIGAIEPGDEGLNLNAQVVSVENVGKKARVVLGDETGIVKAFLPQRDALVTGGSIVLFGGEALVVKQHIEIQLGERGKIDVARREVNEVNTKVDISSKEWVEQA